ncbi:MAG: molybdate ABC transporter substrate-binding protein [Fretibacterium sp.]|nr:molybdate ABC transporter substrate-binding protein [Fretibacterium sp.]
MKRFMAVMTAAVSVFAGFLAQPAAAADRMVLTVFAAASLQAAMERAGALWTEANPHCEILYNFDSSGTLKTQIEEGAECDLFISAARKPMDALEEAGLIDRATRIDLLENKVVLAVPPENPAGIRYFRDLGTDRLSMIALGNSDVPAGTYAREILENAGLWDKLNGEKRISFASNVTEVALQVREGAVDCGIVYATDAATHGLTVVAGPPAGTLKTPVVYPAAVLSRSARGEEARDFLRYLQSPEARKIFISIGFTPAR